MMVRFCSETTEHRSCQHNVLPYTGETGRGLFLYFFQRLQGFLDGGDGEDDDGAFLSVAELALTGMGGCIVDDFAENLALIVRAVVLAYEVADHASLLEDEPLDSQPACYPFHLNDAHEFLCLCGWCAETVLKAFLIVGELTFVGEGVEFPVQAHALAARRNKGVGKECWDVGLDFAGNLLVK